MPEPGAVRLDPDSGEVLGTLQAEVFVEVNQRTPFEYFFKPMQEQIARAFREH